MISLITSNLMLKSAFVYSCAIQLFSFLTPSNTQANDFLNDILSAIPSQIAGYLGVVYGVAIVAKKVSEVWKSHHLDRVELKTAKEVLLQKIIETKKQREN
jgi:ABC-type phosphate transport system permease subunit